MKPLDIVLISLAILLVVILVIETIKMKITYLTIKNKNITKGESKEGIRIVYFSDLHIGRLMQEKELRKTLDKIFNIEADLYIFGGDLSGQNVKKYYSVSKVKEIFSKYSNKTILAIHGNHEFKDDKQDLTFKNDIFDAMGFTNLINKSYTFRKDDKSLSIYGIEDCLLKDPIYPNEDYDLVILHEPDPYINIKGQVAMTGHTHAGQLKLPLLPFYKPALGKKYTYGIYEDNKLYVSSGIGYGGAKIRLCSEREIVVINYIK